MSSGRNLYTVSPVRQGRRRSIAQRGQVAVPGLTRALRRAMFRLRPGSLLRRVALVAGVRDALQAVNRRDWDVVLGLYAPDAEFLPMPTAGDDVLALDVDERYVGPAGVREFFARWDEAWTEFEAHPERVIDLGDRVVVLLHYRGRARGSGLEIDQPAAQVYHWRGGLVVRAELYAERDGALAELGLEPLAP